MTFLSVAVLNVSAQPELTEPSILNDSTAIDQKESVIIKDKGAAIFIGVAVGMLGIHRWYLGTSPLTVVAYAVTLGGCGVVWISDIIYLIKSKEITAYINNPRFFMWGKQRKNVHSE